jgi:peroxidase
VRLLIAYKEAPSLANQDIINQTMAITAKSFTFLLISSLFLVSCICAKEARDTFPVVNGLSWSFYDYSCPKAESIIRKQLKKVFKNDIGQAAGLLRLHFHDCFVQVTK